MGAAHAWSACLHCSGLPGARSLLTPSHRAALRGSCPTPTLMGLGGSSSVLLLSWACTAELCTSLRTYGANGGFPPPHINSSGSVNSCRRALSTLHTSPLTRMAAGRKERAQHCLQPGGRSCRQPCNVLLCVPMVPCSQQPQPDSRSAAGGKQRQSSAEPKKASSSIPAEFPSL